jgi:hypothetical protein
MVTEELMAILAAAAIVPDHTHINQVLAAINQLINKQINGPLASSPRAQHAQRAASRPGQRPRLRPQRSQA